MPRHARLLFAPWLALRIGMPQPPAAHDAERGSATLRSAGRALRCAPTLLMELRAANQVYYREVDVLINALRTRAAALQHLPLLRSPRAPTAERRRALSLRRLAGQLLRLERIADCDGRIQATCDEPSREIHGPDPMKLNINNDATAYYNGAALEKLRTEGATQPPPKKAAPTAASATQSQLAPKAPPPTVHERQRQQEPAQAHEPSPVPARESPFGGGGRAQGFVPRPGPQRVDRPPPKAPPPTREPDGARTEYEWNPDGTCRRS